MPATRPLRMRALWTNESITFDGHWEQIDAAGIVPLPVQRPIPIWIGGYAEKTLKRVAAIGDGWFPWREPDALMEATLERLRRYVVEAGRQFEEIGLEPQLNVGTGTPDDWHAFIEGWRRLGATHLCLTTMKNGYTSPVQHIAALERAANELGVS